MAIGTSPNPLIRNTTMGIETNKKGCFVVDDYMQTTKDGVFAGEMLLLSCALLFLPWVQEKKQQRALMNIYSLKSEIYLMGLQTLFASRKGVVISPPFTTFSGVLGN